MSDTTDPRFTQEHQDACSRRLDAALRPINDAALARRGITREQLLSARIERRLFGPQPPEALEMLAGATEAVAAAERRTA